MTDTSSSVIIGYADHRKQKEGLLDGRTKVTAVALGAVFLIAIPYIHLGGVYKFWVKDKPQVDRIQCTCNCWDTWFKGSYQTHLESHYKHVYFSCTTQTFKIWAITIVYILLIYETIQYIFRLFMHFAVRKSMFILLAVVVYPHYYSWWNYFNYWNDDYYTQWNHQLFFTITELLSTLFVVRACDSRESVLPREMLAIMAIATVHILASGVDQAVANIFLGQGAWHQYMRDVGFLVPDLLHVVLPLCEVVRLARNKGLGHAYSLYTGLDILAAIFTIVLSLIIVGYL